MRQRTWWSIALVVVVAAAATSLMTRAPNPSMQEQIAMANAARPVIALDGFDATSYFDGAPVKGDPRFTSSWHGQQYHFVSAANQTKFAANPVRFAPAFGGHCAFAMSLGKVAEASPSNWMVIGETLYLQKNAVALMLFRVLPGRLAKAQENWTKIKPTT